MDIRFAKLHSGGRDFLIVNSLDSRGQEGKDLAVALCRGTVGAAGLALVRHHGLGRFEIDCYEADGTPAWRGGTFVERMLACAAHAIRTRYGLSRPLLILHQLPHTAVVHGSWVCVTALDQGRPSIGPMVVETSRWYSVSLLFQGDAIWPPPSVEARPDCPWCEGTSTHPLIH